MANADHRVTMGANVEGDLDELETAIERTLERIAHVESQYEYLRESVDVWSGSIGQKKRLRMELADRYRKEFKPLVLQLADLQHRKVRATIYASIANRVPSMSAAAASRV